MAARKPAATTTTITAAKKTVAKAPVKAAAKTAVKAPAKTAAKAPARTTTKVTTAPAVKAPVKAIKERFSKTQIVTQLAEQTELTRKQVSAVLDGLTDIIEGHTSKKGCGEFVLPGILKIVTIKKPARKARKGINPFTGEETMFAAKPASTQVKIRPLKKLKEMPL